MRFYDVHTAMEMDALKVTPSRIIFMPSCSPPRRSIIFVIFTFSLLSRRRRRRCGSRSLFETIFPERNSHFLLRNRFRPDNKSSRAKRQRMLISAVKKLSVRARRKHLISAKAAGTQAGSRESDSKGARAVRFILASSSRLSSDRARMCVRAATAPSLRTDSRRRSRRETQN